MLEYERELTVGGEGVVIFSIHSKSKHNQVTVNIFY